MPRPRVGISTASWKLAEREVLPSLGELRCHPVLAVDLNHGHLAACVVDPSGNPIGEPFTVPVNLGGVRASTRDGHLGKRSRG